MFSTFCQGEEAKMSSQCVAQYVTYNSASSDTLAHCAQQLRLTTGQAVHHQLILSLSRLQTDLYFSVQLEAVKGCFQSWLILSINLPTDALKPSIALKPTCKDRDLHMGSHCTKGLMPCPQLMSGSGSVVLSRKQQGSQVCCWSPPHNHQLRLFSQE